MVVQMLDELTIEVSKIVREAERAIAERMAALQTGELFRGIDSETPVVSA